MIEGALGSAEVDLGGFGGLVSIEIGQGPAARLRAALGDFDQIECQRRVVLAVCPLDELFVLANDPVLIGEVGRHAEANVFGATEHSSHGQSPGFSESFARPTPWL